MGRGGDGGAIILTVSLLPPFENLYCLSNSGSHH